MNSVLKNFLQSVDGQTTENITKILENSETYANKTFAKATSLHGLCVAEISYSMQVKSVKINRERFQDLKQIIENNNHHDDTLCTILEKEILSACQNATNKIAKKCNEIMDVNAIIQMKNKKFEDIGEFEE